MKYSKILVALDRSSQADGVFEQALEIAKKEEASLMLLHCLPIEAQVGRLHTDLFGTALINYSGEIQAQWEAEKQETREWFNRYSQKAIAQGVPTESVVKLADASLAIRELAQAWGADLVVLGRRGYRGLAEVVLGSVSNYVMHYVSCSVLVVQGISPSVDETLETATQAHS